MMSVSQRRALEPMGHPGGAPARGKSKPSRLEALQVDFQNKMMKEKEERMMKHVDNERLRQQQALNKYQEAESSRNESAFSAPGGVRSFFKERRKTTTQLNSNSAGPITYTARKKEGYDKSRPLVPINHNAQNPSRLPHRGYSDPSILHSSKAEQRPTDFEKWRAEQDMLDRQRRLNALNKNNPGHQSPKQPVYEDRAELMRRQKEEEELERRIIAAEKQEKEREKRSVIKQKQEEKRLQQAEQGRRRREESERRQREMAEELQRKKEAEQVELDEQAEMIKQLEEELKAKQKDLDEIKKRKPRDVDLTTPEPYQPPSSRTESKFKQSKPQQYTEEPSLITKPRKVNRRNTNNSKPKQAETHNTPEMTSYPAAKGDFPPSKSVSRTKSNELNSTYKISRENSIPIRQSSEGLAPFVVDGEGLDIDLSPCNICGRQFAVDRLAKHQKACKKVSKPRKQFNPTAQRIAGSGAEEFQYKKKQQALNNKQPPKKDWRAQREEFIASIRYAKMAAAIEAKGGDISSLPPPPKAENPDYVQCPHCNRRFNQTAGERHIPKCKDIKAKPSMLKKGGRR